MHNTRCIAYEALLHVSDSICAVMVNAHARKQHRRIRTHKHGMRHGAFMEAQTARLRRAYVLHVTHFYACTNMCMHLPQNIYHAHNLHQIHLGTAQVSIQLYKQDNIE